MTILQYVNCFISSELVNSFNECRGNYFFTYHHQLINIGLENKELKKKCHSHPLIQSYILINSFRLRTRTMIEQDVVMHLKDDFPRLRLGYSTWGFNLRMSLTHQSYQDWRKHHLIEGSGWNRHLSQRLIYNIDWRKREVSRVGGGWWMVSWQ
jgi:hypothetical protein